MRAPRAHRAAPAGPLQGGGEELKRHLPCVAAAAVTAFWLVWLKPWTLDYPLNDDFAYLLAAKRLCETGVLRLTDWAPATQVLHLAWGALWAKVFGWDLGTLKVGTMLWTLAGACALGKALREEGAGPGAAAVGVLIYLLNPLVAASSISFMTEAPFLTLEVLSLYAFLRGLRREEDRWLLLGGLFAAGAYLVRQVGLLLPVGAAWALWRAGRLDAKRAARVLAPAAAAFAAYSLWFRFRHGPTLSTQNYLIAGTLARLGDPAALVRETLHRIVGAGAELSLFLLPLAPAFAVRKERDTRWGAAFAGALAVLCLDLGALPYFRSVLSHTGLGAITVAGGAAKLGGLYGSSAVWGLATGGAIACGFLLAAAAPTLSDPTSRRLLAATAALQLAASLLGENYFDRYLLVLLPPALLAFLPDGDWNRPTLTAAGLLLAGLGAATTAGLTDYVAWTRAERELSGRAIASGAAPEAVAGSWSVDGYAYYEPAMERLKAQHPLSEIDEWDWRRGTRGFVVSFDPALPGSDVEKVDSQPYPTPLGRDAALFLYKVRPD